ncbi:MAG: peptide/nickel transport system permease protein, partial [Ilumatobacter sp.]
MALVEPGPTGVKTEVEAVAAIEASDGPGPAKRRLGLMFSMSAMWIVGLVFLAVFRDILPIRDPDELGIRTGEVEKFEGLGWNALLGGDGRGRDMFARVVQGARPALILGVTVTLFAAVIGSAVGVTAGYLRGRFDSVTTILIDIALAFPVLVLLISVRATFGNSMLVFIILFSLTSIPGYARIVRGASFALSEREFVDAAAAMGATKRRILLRELAPNIAIPVLSFAFIGFALVIVAEGGLAFIGLSLDEITWGKLIAEGSGDIDKHAHVALGPATVMFLTILAFNLVGDSMRQLYSPREVATQR